MPASYQTYTANGSTESFPVPFPYLSRSHVFVGVAGTQVPFTWDHASSVRPLNVPLAGQSVEVRRFTPTTATPIDFASGAVLLEDTLDVLARYCAYLAEETREGTMGVGGTWTPYTLPVATTSVLGGVKEGSGVSIAPDGTLTATGALGSYTLPIASPTTLGGIKIGANLSVGADGTVSAPAPGVGGVAPLGGIALPTFTLDGATPQGLVKYPNTNPAGWHTGAGRMTVDMEMFSNNYFAANPNGHFAVILRNTASLLMEGGAVRGQGVAIGNGKSFYPYPNEHAPTVQLESWFNPYPPGGGPRQSLPKYTETPPGAVLKDGTPYRLVVEATKAADGNRYYRYRLYEKDVLQDVPQWRCLHDTGDVLDVNPSADLTEYGFAVGHVIASNLSPWSLQFSNCRITWGPATDSLPDLSSRFPRFGGDLEGNLQFKGSGRRLRVKCDGVATTEDWTIVESNVDNSNTSLAFRPRGTSRASGISCLNSSTFTSYGSVSLSMLTDRGRIETFSIGEVPRPFDISIQGTTVASFNTDGMLMNGASVPIGTQTTSLWASGTDGSNVLARAQNSVNWNTICADGAITGTINSFGTAYGVELTALPLYGALGWLITELRRRKVI